MKTAGRIAKGIVIFLLYFICGLFVLRCCLAADQSSLDEIYPTEALRAAYAAEGDALVLNTHGMVNEISEDGYMAAYAYVEIPSAGEVQLTVRYNDSVYSYNSLPEGEKLTFALIDSVTGEEFPATVVDTDGKWMYHYERLVFSGATVREDNNLTLVMYCGGVEISRDVIHYADQNAVTEPYKLSRAEKKSLS